MAWELVRESDLPPGTPDGTDMKTNPLEPAPPKPPKPPDPPGFKYVWK